MNGRWRHLVRLWRAYLASEELPQCDRWLAAALRAERSFGSRDRRWYGEMFFLAMRWGYLASFLTLAHSMPSETLATVVAELRRRFSGPAELLAWWREIDPEGFLGWVWLLANGAPGVPPGLADWSEREAFLLRWLPELEARPETARLRLGFPHFFEDKLARRADLSGWDLEKTRGFVAALRERPPLWLRARSNADLDRAVSQLRQEGLAPESRGLALSLPAGTAVSASTPFRNGLVEVQDLASQLAGGLVTPLPGEVIWDACAGGGGKTLQMASSGVRVWASDVRGYKLDEIRARAMRANLGNVGILPWDGGSLPALPPEARARGGFDWVVVDAPCSGSGTWRRSPDGKWRATAAEIARLASLQQEILARVASAVRPGGRLVYLTCSWFSEENEEVVSSFRARFPQFVLGSQGLFGSPELDSDTLFGAVLNLAKD